ncbi:EthD domain-containing protein [Novosphingobium soli]|uniref:EthD domain-containing protein n=1 Tax=Novosphingobium soli TaxID=574956 RepID=A0ABV6CRB1_9SPHN
MTVTVVTLLTRRPGMSREAFRAYYETHHRVIGERVLAGYATRYVRRFLDPLDGTEAPFDCDVVMEIDFPDEATRDTCFAALAEPAVAAMIAEDEERLFDRGRTRTFSVIEHASSLAPLAPGASAR